MGKAPTTPSKLAALQITLFCILYRLGLVNVFFSHYKDPTQDSFYYWHRRNFKVPHFFFTFCFQIFVFNRLLFSLVDILLSVDNEKQIKM